jgi:type I restriction enzyme S subunit
MSSEVIGPIKDFSLGIFDGPHATPTEATEGPIFLGIKNVTPDGRLDLSETRRVSEEDFSKWTKRVTPQEDDIVFFMKPPYIDMQ